MPRISLFGQVEWKIANVQQARGQLCRKKKSGKFSSVVLLTLTFWTVRNFLLPNVTLHVRLYQSPNNTVLHLKGTDDDAKNLDGTKLPVVEKKKHLSLLEKW